MKRIIALALPLLLLAGCATQQQAPLTPADLRALLNEAGGQSIPLPTVHYQTQTEFDTSHPRNSGGCGMTVLSRDPNVAGIYLLRDTTWACAAHEISHWKRFVLGEPMSECLGYRFGERVAGEHGEWNLAQHEHRNALRWCGADLGKEGLL